ncbi:protein of unknown function [Taphrina deformans PYCC 5710]|uniref:Xylanolytic transcriptional activator regulatory domain-containing protein n=1 Tax=Taphrina deformans (strain PYCC 5710 / ATCC 11124 / CBS 356.35 / IMI 108563 / JCM 9778 / NBRC 8474) TaxID=1097556 RepID=R4XFD8_TAPDE|nr:protein of unknown function [Taphrina deformans PYCC 5710]|eukprot:CCG84491.1 protein of unknown function [Taphrina deformans PYCC 5710]
MMFSAVRSPDASSLETPVNPVSRPGSLPTFAEIQTLLQIYMNHSCPQVPILTRHEADVYVKQTYLVQKSPITSEDKTSHYFTHIIAAIAYAKDPADVRAEEQHASALYYLPFVLKGSRLNSLEAILLLTVYGTNRPSTPGIWYTLGIASRLITDLSIHAGADSVKEQTLFWSWYVLDRQICVYLSRPVGIGDNVIHCPIPPLGPVPTSFCELRIMQSEIQRILHHSDTLPREYPTLEEWRRVVTMRLDAWEQKRPKTSAEAGVEFNLDFLTLNYEQTRLLLHGFSSNLPITRSVVLESSKLIVEIYRDLWYQDSVNFIWLAIHNVHIAASSFIYALLQRPNEHATRDLQTMKETVITMLHGMSTRCPASLQILDVFLDLAGDVENRLSLASPSMSSGPRDIGMSELEFMAMINNSSKDSLWDNFIAGEDFTFMDFST